MNELIQKITAPNGGVFTGQGTNTYLIGKKDITLVDPGPNIPEHIEEILKMGSGKIKRIHPITFYSYRSCIKMDIDAPRSKCCYSWRQKQAASFK